VVSHTHEFILPDRRHARPLGIRVATAFALAVTGAALTFFAVLFATIVILLVAGFVRNVAPDMRIAYRVIALPAAMVALPALFAVSLWKQNRTRTSSF